MQDGCRCLGILTTVIYKQCPRDLIKPTVQWDTLRPKCSCSAKECRLWDGARPLSGEQGWRWAEGTGCHSSLWPCCRQLTATLLAWEGVTHRFILKAASFHLFLLCGLKESLSWRSCHQQKEALFEQEQGRPAWGGELNSWAMGAWLLSMNLRAQILVVSEK